MTEKHSLAPLVDVKGYEFRAFMPKQAEAIVEAFFGRGNEAVHDIHTVDGDTLVPGEQGQIFNLVAWGENKMIDWNTKDGSGFIDLDKFPVFAVTAEESTPILIVGEKIDGKIAIVHRFWKATVVEQE